MGQEELKGSFRSEAEARKMGGGAVRTQRAGCAQTEVGGDRPREPQAPCSWELAAAARPTPLHSCQAPSTESSSKCAASRPLPRLAQL